MHIYGVDVNALELLTFTEIKEHWIKFTWKASNLTMLCAHGWEPDAKETNNAQRDQFSHGCEGWDSCVQTQNCVHLIIYTWKSYIYYTYIVRCYDFIISAI